MTNQLMILVYSEDDLKLESVKRAIGIGVQIYKVELMLVLAIF